MVCLVHTDNELTQAEGGPGDGGSHQVFIRMREKWGQALDFL